MSGRGPITGKILKAKILILHNVALVIGHLRVATKIKQDIYKGYYFHNPTNK